MRCRDCIYWKEKWIDREEISSCHLEQKIIRKNGDDFCSHFISRKEAKAKNETQVD